MTRKDPREVVARKRDGKPLHPAEIEAFVAGYVSGEVPDCLASAFLMAAFIRGMSLEETVSLTRAYVESGRTLELAAVGQPKVDKHSTGGVADGVTLVFAPLAASMGLAVAKLSGRGLGHTGGTLDKLESIPGFRTDLSAAQLESQVERIGCAVAAQTADFVPADGALYALRDATATVASIPLIAASVMSKKLAVGTDLVLLDVKAGSGAFMKTTQDARELARVCVEIARQWGRPVCAAVTDMSQPLGSAIGNALDVLEAVELLRGNSRGRLRELTVRFAAAALSALEGTPTEEGIRRAEASLDGGQALERFRSMVRAQGGDPRVADDPSGVLPAAPIVTTVRAEETGFLTAVDGEILGRASGALGAGRVRKGDPVDPAVGIVFLSQLGDRIESGSDVAVVHAREQEAARPAEVAVRAALTLSERPADPSPLVHEWFE